MIILTHFDLLSLDALTFFLFSLTECPFKLCLEVSALQLYQFHIEVPPPIPGGGGAGIALRHGAATRRVIMVVRAASAATGNLQH